MTLFCFDFDRTLVKRHYSKLLSENGQKPGHADPVLVNQLLSSRATGLKHPVATRNIIRQGLKNGHHFAIVSFSEFPEVFESALKKMGLDEEEISRIHKIADPAQGKNWPLQQAMNHFGVEKTSDVYLIDDCMDNICYAHVGGYNTIQVPEGREAQPTHLEKLWPLVQKPGAECSIEELFIGNEPEMTEATPLHFNQPHTQSRKKTGIRAFFPF